MTSWTPPKPPRLQRTVPEKVCQRPVPSPVRMVTGTERPALQFLLLISRLPGAS